MRHVLRRSAIRQQRLEEKRPGVYAEAKKVLKMELKRNHKIGWGRALQVCLCVCVCVCCGTHTRASSQLKLML